MRPTRFAPVLWLLASVCLPNLVNAAPAQPGQWEPEIKAFEAIDRARRPPTNAVLFVGSSSIRLWKTLAEDLKGMPVINRGFGGSQMSDLLHFTDRIVLPYRPGEVVVYEGDNDLAAGKTPEQVRDDFAAFVKKVHAALPTTRITFLAIKPSPARIALLEKAKTANSLIAQYVSTDRRLGFIDVFTPLLGNDGKPRREFFLPDMLHLNKLGYEVWTTVIRARIAERLREIEAQKAAQ